MCEHGAAKSVIAAALLERLAAANARRVRAIARGTNPDAEVPALVVAGLCGAGIRLEPQPPRGVTPQELAAADRVVSFGPRVEAPAVEYWDDVPPVADGYAAAHAAIGRRVCELFVQLDG